MPLAPAVTSLISTPHSGPKEVIHKNPESRGFALDLLDRHDVEADGLGNPFHPHELILGLTTADGRTLTLDTRVFGHGR